MELPKVAGLKCVKLGFCLCWHWFPAWSIISLNCKRIALIRRNIFSWSRRGTQHCTLHHWQAMKRSSKFWLKMGLMSTCKPRLDFIFVQLHVYSWSSYDLNSFKEKIPPSPYRVNKVIDNWPPSKCRSAFICIHFSDICMLFQKVLSWQIYQCANSFHTHQDTFDIYSRFSILILMQTLFFGHKMLIGHKLKTKLLYL